MYCKIKYYNLDFLSLLLKDSWMDSLQNIQTVFKAIDRQNSSHFILFIIHVIAN